MSVCGATQWIKLSESLPKYRSFDLFDLIYLFNCSWLATRWLLFSTHIHTNNTGNVTKLTIHRTQKYIEQHKKKYIEQHNNKEECGPCPVFAGFTLAFALQLRKKHLHRMLKCLLEGQEKVPRVTKIIRFMTFWVDLFSVQGNRQTDTALLVAAVWKGGQLCVKL
jgi:hypothetical protein